MEDKFKAAMQASGLPLKILESKLGYSRFLLNGKTFYCVWLWVIAWILPRNYWKVRKEYGDIVVSDYDLNKINDHKAHSFYNVTSVEAFIEALDTSFAKEWDKEKNCKDLVYKLELVE